MLRNALLQWSARFGVLLGGVFVAALSLAAGQGDRWEDAGSTAFPRLAATATDLGDGRTLVVGGGFAGSPVADSELYSPTSGWVPGPAIPTPRMEHTAVRLLDGRVLVAGGFHPPTSDNSSPVDLFDPTTNTWATNGFIRPPRLGHSATILNDGRVLIVGGNRLGDAAETLGDVELFDPTNNTWAEGESLPLDRTDHTATMLPSGRVLVAGGTSRGGAHPGGQGAWNDAWLYWPDRDAWGEMPAMRHPRHRHAAVALGDGRVLVSGGALMNRDPIAEVELYDWKLHGWVQAPPMREPRHSHTATLLPDGRVLVQGGFGENDKALDRSEIYDPAADVWLDAAPSPGPYWHAQALADGSILFFGGPGLNYLTEAEVFDPERGAWSPAGRLMQPRRFFAISPLLDGGALVRGGSGLTDVAVPPAAERFDPKRMMWEPTKPPPGKFEASEPTVPLGNGRTLEVQADPGGGRHYFWVRDKERKPLGRTLAVQGKWTASPIPGGRALVVGGWFRDGQDELVAPMAWVVDAEGGVKATEPLVAARMNHVAVTLRDGRVMVMGGESDPRHRLSSAEIYDPDLGTWALVEPMRSGRISHTAALLPDGRVLVLGGYGGSAQTSRYVPAP